MPPEERKGIGFGQFGGLRLDLGQDEAGPTNAIFSRDVDFDFGPGGIRPRDGFQKIKAGEATGEYKGLFAHSQNRLLAVKLVSAGELKLVSIDQNGNELANATWPTSPGFSNFARFGTPAASYTYARAQAAAAKVIRYDGTLFVEPTATVDGVAAKEMPKGQFMIAWPDGGNRLVCANTSSTGGPGGAASSNSHVWFSDPGSAESWHTVAPEANYVQLSPGDGEEITGMAVWGSLLFVFKQTRFFVFYSVGTDSEGAPVFNYRTVDLGDGGIINRPSSALLSETSDQICCAADRAVYFLTSDGVWATTGQAPTKISQALRPLEEDFTRKFDGPMQPFLEMGNETFRWPAQGIAFVNRRLYVRRIEATFVYDLETQQWISCWKQFFISMCPSRILSPLRPRLFITNGKFVAWTGPGATSELTTPVPEWQSGFYDLGTEDEKALVETKIYGNGEVTLSSFKDLATAAGFTDTLQLGANPTYKKSHKAQTGGLLSHRVKLGTGAKVQRVVRYLRETRVATTQTGAK